MGLSINTYTYTSGDQRFPVAFTLGFISRADVRVQVNDQVDGDGDPVYAAFEWIDDTEIEVTDPLVDGDSVEITRTVSKTALEVDFDAGADVTKANLNAANLQVMMLLHEIIDQREDAGIAELLQITVEQATIALGALEADAQQHAVNAQAAAASASDASTEASDAEAIALFQAAQSSNEATNAAASAATAVASAAAALASESVTAADAATTTAAANDISSRWLGGHATNAEAETAAGAGLESGSCYYNTNSGDLLIYDGVSSWVGLVGGSMSTAANLGDVADAAAARVNLGVEIGADVQAYSAILAAVQVAYTTAMNTKLNGIEAGANVTDFSNVQSAGAIMDAECASPSAVKTMTSAFTTAYKAQLDANTANFTTALKSKLDAFTATYTSTLNSKLNGIESGANVTDYANVSASGALMNNQCASVSSVKGINQSLSTTSSPTFNTPAITGNLKVAGDLRNAFGEILFKMDNAPYIRDNGDDGRVGLEANGTGYSHRIGGSGTQVIFKFLGGTSGSPVQNTFVRANGELTTVTLLETSDERVKSDIVDASSQWSDIKDLRLCNYTMNATGDRHLGVIAQETALVSPGLVKDISEELDGSLLAVNKSGLMMKMMGALQEAMQRIEELEAKVG